MISHRQIAKPLHPLSAAEIEAIVAEVTRAVLAVVKDLLPKPPKPAPKPPPAPRVPAIAGFTCPNVRRVIDAACRVTGISYGDMIGPRRARALAWPRQVAMLAAVKLAPQASLPQIGRAFSRDHTTVMYAARVAAVRCAANPHEQATYDAIVAAVKAGEGATV